jgi:hypothetical protein
MTEEQFQEIKKNAIKSWDHLQKLLTKLEDPKYREKYIKERFSKKKNPPHGKNYFKNKG